MSNRDECRCSGPKYLTAFGRRSFIQAGFLGGFGLTLADLLQSTARAGVVRPEGSPKRPEGRAKSVIQIILPGGLAHQESWDPKPEAPIEFRGPLGVVKTKIPGVVFSENLSQTAQIADKITVVRSITGRIPDHAQATYQMFTGYLPTPAIQHPSVGAVVSHEFGPRNNLPAYVGLPNVPANGGGTGYLSSKYGAFELGADPGQKNFKVRDISLPAGMSEERFDRRRSAREALEDHFRQVESNPAELDAMGEFYQQAYKLISSPEARKAFSLDGEPDAIAKLYGDGISGRGGRPASIGRQLMLARRLVEAGVRLVTVMYNGSEGWDNHQRIKEAVNNGMPAFDHAFAGLIADLDQRGLLDTTIVTVTSEFGRTPKLNENGGRDHWARVYSQVIAGGGITRGQIYGASNATASEPDRDPVTVENFLATVYHQLGINAEDRLLAPGGRPIDIVRDGRVVEGLCG